MPLDTILASLEGVRQSGKEWQALCPAHEDSNPSLSVTEGKGGILVHCHAGCSTEAVLEAIGLEMRDLCGGGNGKRKPKGGRPSENAETVSVFAKDASGKTGLTERSIRQRRPDGKGRIVETYDYTDAEGRVLYEVCRFEPKDFRQRRPDGKGGWVWSLKGIEPVLYRLPAVREAVRKGDPVFVAEGERDVHSLEGIGLVATTNCGGAGKWRDSYSEEFRGAKCVILPDNDGPGRKHGIQVANSLTGKASSVKSIELPGLAEKQDITDWLDQGHAKEELLRLVEQAEEYEPAELPEEPQAEFKLTDLGNAERLIAAHGENLRFNVDSGRWLVWNGRAWESDHTGAVDRLAREVVRSIYEELANAGSRETADSLYTHVKKSESAPRLAAMVGLARHCAGVPVRSSDLDSDPWLLACENGTLDLRANALERIHPHKREDLITKLSPVSCDPQAKCGRWERFLVEVLGGNEELIGFTKRLCGYLLTGDTREQSFVILQGKGSNGKSLFLEVLRHIVGEYAKDTPITTFLERRESNTSDLASLAGARMVTASEGEETSSFNEALVKKLTGQDAVTCRHLYQDFFTYAPTFKVLFSTNEVPRIRSQNYSMKRRVKLLPFRVRFYYEHEQKVPVRDEALLSKLRAESSGILRWMVEGCLQWQASGLGMPSVMQEAVDSLFESMDPLLEFIEAKCELHPRLEVESGELWQAYLDWCEGEKQKPIFKRASDFTRCLSRRDGIEPKRTKKARLLSGIGLIGDDDKPSESAKPINRMTADDAKTGFGETSLMKGEYGIVSGKGEMASPGVTFERETSENPLPEDPCPACGATDWRHEPAALGGKGGFVCRSCKRMLSRSRRQRLTPEKRSDHQ